MSEERPYLVVYDYDTGGIWWWITAKSSQEITDTYHTVQVIDKTPKWWTEEMDRVAMRVHVSKPNSPLKLFARPINGP